MEDAVSSKGRLLLYVIGANLVILVTVICGVIGQFIHWLLFDSFGRASQRARRKLRPQNNLKDDEYFAIIIGAGFSGLGMGIRLNELGVEKYLIIERHKHVGGTWYANQYPGCACDVPSNLYSFSFEPNPKWSYFFSRQPEIGEYLQHCADKYDIRRHIKTDTTATDMQWIEERQIWQVTTKSNDIEQIFYARFLIAGYGPLSNASYPTDIPGMDQFEGQMCHTAQWDKTIDFKNKRVAVIGTGASAIQVVPELHKLGLKQMTIFQRTAPWIIPRADRVVKNWEKQIFARFPIIQKMIRVLVYWVRESTVLSFTYRLPVRFINQELVKYNLRRQVADKVLRKKLTPTWDLGCKRVLLSNDWYSTIQQENVTLVTNRIRALTKNSIVTHEGDEYPVDIIVWSTGFQVQIFPLAIRGRNNATLVKQWSETMQVS
jgi:cation diffusion facilitator CzcD-associated flavoprotein CzcO